MLKTEVPRAQAKIQAGDWDGLTIMRYAQFYRHRFSGGVEQQLRRLNHGLLQRHRLHLLQVHRVGDLARNPVEMEDVGLGRITWIPVAYRNTASKFRDLPARARFIYNQS